MYSSTSEEDRANRYSAEEERGRLLLVTTVDLGDGLTDKIELRAGDCPEVLSTFEDHYSLFKGYMLRQGLPIQQTLCQDIHCTDLPDGTILIYRRQQQRSAKEMYFQRR